MSRRDTASGEAGVAQALERLAVLLEAGVAPRAAWEYVGDVSHSGGVGRVASVAGEALARGRPAAPAISGAAPDGGGVEAGASEAWRQVAAAWEVAEVCGAPLGPALRALASSLRAQDAARRAAEVALAGPRTASRVVLALPAVGVLLGVVLGIDGLGVLIGTPIGWALLVTAGALVAVARLWTARLLAAAALSQAVPGLEAELVAVAIGGGGAWDAARSRVRVAMGEHCAACVDATESAAVDEVLALSERSGAPGAELLRSLADDRRRQRSTAAAIAVERLGVLVMLPLGICILPAFVLVGVAPMAFALLSSTGGSP